jgi:anti-sigma factor RsiW
MMAASRKIVEQEPTEIELLLPWHAAGTLSARDSRRVEEALARDPELARQYAVIREEYAGTIDLNESLGAPSVRAMQKLFAAIDAEPAQRAGASLNLTSRFADFFASLSPRTLAWSASLGAFVLVLQAGVLAAVLMNNRPATFETASLSNNEPITRDLRAVPAQRALVRFAPDARMGDITALLDKYQASIVGGASGGMFRLQFAAATKDEFSNLLGRLQNEKIVSLAVATP